MKKLFIICFFLSYLFTVQAVNVTVNQPGTLKSVFLLKDVSLITDLTINGTLDARDFKFIRDDLKGLE